VCGIAGIFEASAAREIDQRLLRQMTNTLAHRGPDGEGYFTAPGVGLGHRRLAIIDVAHGQQPMLSDDRSVALTFNGQIYNYMELMRELEKAGFKFRTKSDTEVILHAWRQWGINCVEHFRGMFAFAIYDRSKDLIFLARDRFGKKPLYYSITSNNCLVFASELKALLTVPNISRRLDPVAVDQYFAFGYVPEPRSIYDGIYKLAPAHTLEMGRNGLPPTPRRYWRLFSKSTGCDEHEAARELMARLDEAVRIRLMSEVPLGAFLSGGVDSSGIVASMARQTDSSVKTFALGFQNDPQSELPHARRIARLYATDHHESSVSVAPLTAYQRQARIFDEPFADSSSIPTLEISRLAREKITVALSGDAGDEIFGGYRRYRWHAITDRVRRTFPSNVRQNVFGTLAAVYPKLDWAPQWLRAKTTFSEIAASSADGYFRSVCRTSDNIRERLYSQGTLKDIEGCHPAELIATAMNEANSDDPLTCAQYADLATYLPGDILTKVDRASMAVSLEVRVPMLDHDLVEWAVGLPSDFKLRGKEGKYLLKRALEPYIPAENLYRRKRGFATSLANEFRHDTSGMLRSALTGDMIADSGIFDMTTVRRILDSHESGMRDNSQALWTLLMFSGFLSAVHSGSSSAHFDLP
jgi:asparagine synthase (glutamine-hydrolysing)